MKLRSANGNPIAIDLGSASVKLLQVDPHGPRPVVTGALFRTLPAGLPAPEYEARVETILSDALRGGAFRGRRVVLALQPGQFEIKSFRMPRMPREEMDAALQLEAEDRFGFGEHGQYRYLVAGDVRQGNETKEELIAFGVRETQVAGLLRLLERLKLEASSLDLSPCAMARSFARFLRREEDAAAINVFIDVGARSTDLVMTRGADVAFVKVIEVGGHQLDESVARRLEISVEEARRVRLSVLAATRGSRERGGSSENSLPDNMREAVYDGMRPIVDQIVKELLLCLRYFAVTFRGQQPQSITFVGGEAHNPLLSGLLGEIIDIPCLVGDPLRGMDQAVAPGTLGPWTFRPAWGVAVGLALRQTRWVHAAGTAAPMPVKAGT